MLMSINEWKDGLIMILLKSVQGLSPNKQH